MDEEGHRTISMEDFRVFWEATSYFADWIGTVMRLLLCVINEKCAPYQAGYAYFLLLFQGFVISPHAMFQRFGEQERIRGGKLSQVLISHLKTKSLQTSY